MSPLNYSANCVCSTRRTVVGFIQRAKKPPKREETEMISAAAKRKQA